MNLCIEAYHNTTDSFAENEDDDTCEDTTTSIEQEEITMKINRAITVAMAWDFDPPHDPFFDERLRPKDTMPAMIACT